MWSKQTLIDMLASIGTKPPYEVVDACDVPGPIPVIQIGLREMARGKGLTIPGLHQEVVDLLLSDKSIAVLGYLTEKNRIVVNVMLKGDESTHDEPATETGNTEGDAE